MMGSARDWTAIATLVERSRAGDDDAFRELLQLHRPAVTSTLLACGVRCEDTAGDLAQEVATRVWTGLASLSDPRAFPAWIRRIAANAARDHLRRLGARRETGLEEALDMASGDDPERISERIAELRYMLAALSTEDREIVELLTARAEGTPVAELARRMGISDGALKMRMSRARVRLRERLQEMRDE
jgi:RNA polymerase sigma-70 factor (ECF subfamily)